MGANKKNFMDDAFFNKYFALDGDNVGSHETEEAIRMCYPKQAPAAPPPMPYVEMTSHEKETWEYLKLTNEEKEKKEEEFLAKYGI
jgi:hypothetical protein